MCRGPRPCSRSNHIAALYNDKMLFVFGGAAKSRTLNDLYSLDFEAVCEHSLYMTYQTLLHYQINITLNVSFRWFGQESKCEDFIHRLELVAVEHYVEQNGTSLVVVARKKVSARLHHIACSPFIYSHLFLVSFCYPANSHCPYMKSSSFRACRDFDI